MAIAVSTGLVTATSGKESGTVHLALSNRGVLRAIAAAARSASGRSGASKTLFHQAAVLWSSTLTPTQRGDWSTYGETFPTTNVFGCTTPLTGYQAFMRHAVPQLMARVPINPNAPVGPDVRTPTSFVVTADHAGQQLLVTNYGLGPPAGTVVQILAGPSLSPGSLVVRGASTIIGNFPDPAAPPLDVSAVYTQYFGLLIARRRIPLKLFYVTAATGDKSVGLPFLAEVL